MEELNLKNFIRKQNYLECALHVVSLIKTPGSDFFNYKLILDLPEVFFKKVRNINALMQLSAANEYFYHGGRGSEVVWQMNIFITVVEVVKFSHKIRIEFKKQASLGS